MDPVALVAFPDKPLRDAWRECLNNADFSSHYSAPEYFLEPYYRDQSQFAILAVQNGEVHGVVTGVRNGKVVDCGLGVRPQVVIRRDADPAVVGNVLARGLLDHVGGQAELLNVFTWAPNQGFRAAGFRVRECAGEHGTILLDLTRGADALFKEFSETRRNKIRRAMKYGVDVSPLRSGEEFDVYYDIYKDWCAFKHIQPQSKEMQRAAFELTGNRLILVARHQGQVIGASTFRFCPGGLIEYAANVSRREETKVRQNDLLLWKSIEWAANNGFRTYSMAGAHFFLQKFGGKIHTTYRYRMDRSLLRRHDLKEAMYDARNSMYRRLPAPVQSKLKSVMKSGGESD